MVEKSPDSTTALTWSARDRSPETKREEKKRKKEGKQMKSERQAVVY